jgi:ATP-binding cassette, subfamily B, bacterial
MLKIKTNNLKEHVSLIPKMLGLSIRLRPMAIVIYGLGGLLEIASSLLTIYASAQIAGLLASFIVSGDAGNIWFWLWVDVAAATGIILGFAIMNFAQRLLYFTFIKWSTMQYQAALCRIDMPDYYDEKTRNKINKVSGGYTWQIANFATTNLDLIYGIIKFLAITVVVSQITWWLVPIIILFLIPSLIAEGRVSKILWFVWDEKGDERHTFWGLDWIIRQPKAQMEIRSSQSKSFLLNKVDKMLKTFYGEQEKKYSKAFKIVLPSKLMEIFGTTIGAITVLRQVLAGTISLERYFFLSGALFRVGAALSNIFGTLARMQDMLVFSKSYFELLDQEPKNVDIDKPINISNLDNFEITFDNVTFTYPGSKTPVLENFNFVIKSGEHVAIVGENGAGKSTLIKLLMRFYSPDSGKITINGFDLQNIAIESWYSHIATLFQDFNQYPLPIGENISIGRSNEKYSEDKVIKAAHQAGVDDFTKKYPHGLDTVLDPSFKKGTEPSGGQWQRVALARAFYRQAEIIILDEPTSAIDANAEYNIFNSIFEEYKDKTALIVSHRFSTVRRANRIVVIDKGKIVEQGSHEELLENGRTYHNLFTKQAEGYK